MNLPYDMITELFNRLDLNDIILFSMTNQNIYQSYKKYQKIICHQYDMNIDLPLSKTIKLCYQLNELKKKLNLRYKIRILYDLQDLFIFHREIKEIPNEINQLKKLNYLCLYNNHIEKVNINLPLLKKLDLSNNKITELPNFKHLPNLTYLNLSYNKLTVLSETINKLYQLRHLLLSHNKIYKIPSLNQLKELRVLYIDNNYIIYLPDLRGLHKLVHINIDNNPLIY